MIPTINWTKEKFNEYNAKCFDGKLVTPEFKMVQSRSFAGCVSFRISSPRDTMVLKMSTFYDMKEDELISTLLHEMCHIYFIQDGNITENHGDSFRALVRRLNYEYGLNISERTADVYKINPDIKRKKMFIYIGIDENGRYAWFSSNYQRLFDDPYICGCRIIVSCISDDDRLQGRKATLTERKSKGYYFSSPLDARRMFLNGTNRKVLNNRAFDELLAA